MFKDDYKGRRGLYVIMKNNENTYYDIDIELIERTLREYLNCEDTKNHFRMMRNRFNDTTFGVDVYDRVIEQIDKQLHAEEPDYDIRSLHLIYDHKVLMLERIKYLMANDYIPFSQAIVDDYATVVENAQTARNLLVRISITGEIERADRFAKYLNQAKETEIKVLSQVLEQLEKREK